ncbi:DUF2239 family protein, partial [Oryzibacter oryziterrae]|uniref:DUF2239 family protein n=1 Tax=Oryzibacter oryziterrae TaxID=2766474 RepID=UPI001F29746A
MSVDPLSKPVTAFDGATRLWEGALVEVALAVKAATDAGAAGPLLVFDDATGRVLDLDLRGGTGDVVRRLVALPPEPARSPSAPRVAAEPESGTATGAF